jgi:uncharacterized protein YqfB (UPF0267 family)
MKFEHESDPCVVGVDGLYCETEDTIYLSNTLSKMQKEITYFHERQHRICAKKKCACMRDGRTSDYLAEFHAYRGEMLCVLSSGDAKLMKAYLSLVVRMVKKAEKNPKTWQHHKRAMNRVMKMKEFKRIKRMAK